MKRIFFVSLSLLFFSLSAFAGLTDAQKATFKAALAAETDTTLVAARTARDTGAIKDWYNSLASPDFFVWRPDAPVADILDSISFDKYTPTDAADNTTTWTNRALAVQIKQMNMQIMLQGRNSIDATKANVRAGLRDEVIALPTGVSGTMVASGGASGSTALTACLRKARRIEKLFSVASATTGTVTGNFLVFEGQITDADAAEALQ